MGAAPSKFELDPVTQFVNAAVGLEALNHVYESGTLVKHAAIGDLTAAAVRMMVRNGAEVDEQNSASLDS